MKLLSLFSFLTLTLFLNNCGKGPNDNKPLFNIVINNAKKIYTNNDTLTVSLVNLKERSIDSVIYSINNEK